MQRTGLARLKAENLKSDRMCFHSQLVKQPPKKLQSFSFEICHRDPRKILRASRHSILETRALRIEDRGSSRDCKLTFARYCTSKLTILDYLHCS